MIARSTGANARLVNLRVIHIGGRSISTEVDMLLRFCKVSCVVFFSGTINSCRKHAIARNRELLIRLAETAPVGRIDLKRKAQQLMISEEAALLALNP